MVQYKLDLSEEELSWLQNNTKRYLIKVKANEKNKSILTVVSSLCDKLDEFEQTVLNRNDLRIMQTLVGTVSISLIEGTIPVYKERGGHEDYLERAEKKSKMLLTLLAKLDKIL